MMTPPSRRSLSSDLDQTFAPLADPTRRAILARLARGEAAVGDLAQPFDFSLPAVSRHLHPAPLRVAANWIDRYRHFWENGWTIWPRFWNSRNPRGENHNSPRHVRPDRFTDDPRTATESLRGFRQAGTAPAVVRAPRIYCHRRITQAARRRSLSHDDVSPNGRGAYGRGRISRDERAGAPRIHLEVGRRGYGAMGETLVTVTLVERRRARYRNRGFSVAHRFSGAASARRAQWRLEFIAQLPRLHAMIRRYVLQSVFQKGADGTPDRALIDKAVPEIKSQLAVLDHAYGQRNLLVGDTVTLADLLLAPIVFYLGMFPESKALLATAPNVSRAHAAMAERESFKTTAPKLG